jgi:hypothetical protein
VRAPAAFVAAEIGQIIYLAPAMLAISPSGSQPRVVAQRAALVQSGVRA